MLTRFSPTQRVAREGGRIAYDRAGDPGAPAVLCLPSLGDTRAEYRALAPRLLAAGAQVLTADLRGHGESDASFERYAIADHADDLLAVLDHARVERAVIAGCSLSAASALVAAARRPDRISGLLLLGPVTRDLPAGRWMRPLFRPMFAPWWGARLWSAFYGSLFKRTRPADLPAHQAALRSLYADRARRRALVETMLAPKDESHAAWSKVHVPTAIVMGTADPDFPDARAEAEALAAGLGGPTELHLLAGVGHYPHLEDPDAALAAYLGLRARLEPARAASGAGR